MLRTRTFRSLRHRLYRLYFLGQLVSFIGSWMSSAALMWLAYDRTDDPLWPPLLLAAQVGPTLFIGPIGGTIADRFPKRRSIILTQLAFMIAAFVLAACVAFDGIQPVGWFGLPPAPYVLIVLAFVNGVIQAIDLPLRLSFVPDLVPREDLMNAVSLSAMLFNAARAIGPALAGLIFVFTASLNLAGSTLTSVSLGAIICFLLNGLSFIAVIFNLLQMPHSVSPSRNTTQRTSLWDGFRFLQAQPRYMGLVILTGTFSTFAWPVLTLLPAYTRLVLGQREQSYTSLVSALGVGALCGAIVTATYASIDPARRAAFLLGGTTIGLLALVFLALVHNPILAMMACFAMGFGLILYLSTGQSTMQLAAPDAVRGRIMALWAMTLGASAPAGHILAGVLAQQYPVPWVLGGMAAGVAATGVALAVLLWKDLTSMSTAHSPAIVPVPTPTIAGLSR
ncbi:MAG: MFS transporter [Gemmataceae bacterium]